MNGKEPIFEIFRDLKYLNYNFKLQEWDYNETLNDKYEMLAVLLWFCNYYAKSQWLSCQQIFQTKQECIPVGCVPPARYRTVGVPIWGVCVRGSVSRGVSVQGSLCPGGLCPGGSLSRVGFCQGGSLSRGVSVQGVLCPWSLCRVIWTAQFEDEFPVWGWGSGHFWTLIRKCPHIWTLTNLNLEVSA